jgi:glycerophosphoryl diester phosphodiesterase
LLRTAGVDIRIDEITEEDLNAFRLEGTEERIPLFRQVLELYRGHAPLIVELKSDRGNHAALCKAVCDMLEDYNGLYCIESFDPRCIAWLKKHRPDIVRGQLSENFFPAKHMPFYLKPVMSWNMTTFLTKPDFIAFRFQDRKCFSIWVMRKIWKMQGVTWTLRSMEEYEAARKEGWIPIFENFIP